MCSDTAVEIIDSILNEFKTNYPEAEIAIIAPFKDTVKELQKHFLTVGALINLTIETVDRIQGMTADYAIIYFPGWKPSFALDERRFNVSTSRSRTITLILTDVSLENMHSAPGKVITFLERCYKLNSCGRISQPTDEPSINSEPEVQESQETNLEASTPVIRGPKVVGKIDLSKFERPKKELKKDKQNYYVIDTNVFVNCPDIINKVESKYPVILSAKVIDELDKLKIKMDDAGKSNVQKALRSINQCMDNRDVRMELADTSLLPNDFDKRSPDNLILTVALKFKDENPILLTSDNGLQVKAKGLGITTITLKEFLKH